MNAVRLTCNVLRFAGPLRYTPSAFNPAALNKLAYSKTIKKTLKKIVKEVASRPKNDKIGLEVVQVANSDGKLDPPEPLADVLARTDLKEFYVELVVEDKSIVKIFNKREERAKAKARDKARNARMRANEQKEIQMTWGVASGDIAHKLDKVRKELEKQARVDLIFAPKSKQVLPPPEERDEKVAEVLEMLKDVGKEWMPRTFRKSQLTVHLRGIAQQS